MSPIRHHHQIYQPNSDVKGERKEKLWEIIHFGDFALEYEWYEIRETIIIVINQRLQPTRIWGWQSVTTRWRFESLWQKSWKIEQYVTSK